MTVSPELYLTVEEFRARIGDASGRDDQLIGRAISYAVQQVEEHCGRSFLQGPTEARYFRATSQLLTVIDDLRSQPSLVEVGVSGRSGTFRTITNVFADGKRNQPFTRIEIDGNGYTFNVGPATWTRVTGDWGWQSVPPAVIGAIELQAGKLFKRKDSMDAVMAMDGVGIRRLDSGHDRDAISLLRGYCRTDRTPA